MTDAIKELTHAGCNISIYVDDEPSNPREEWDHPGTYMVCWHSRYTLGDVDGAKKYGDPKDFMLSLACDADDELSGISERVDRVCWHFDESSKYYKMAVDYLEKRTAKALESYVIIPLHLYDHSGITMSTGSFNDPWDSCQVGWIYMSLASALECQMITDKDGSWDSPCTYNGETKTLYQRTVDLLESEVKEYDQYLTGDVYWYNIELFDDGEVAYEESCSGFFGLDYCIREAKEIAEHLNRVHQKNKVEISEIMHL